MKKFKHLVIGGIQHKIFNVVLLTAVLIVAAFSLITFYQYRQLAKLSEDTNGRQQEAIRGISEETMQTVIREGLQSETSLQASIADEMFNDVQNQVDVLADSAEALLSSPEAHDAYPVYPPRAQDAGKTMPQLVWEEGVDPSETRISARVELLGNMVPQMITMWDNVDHLNTCLVALPEGVLIMVDNCPEVKVREDGSVTNIPVRYRPWYTGAAGSRKMYFSDIEKDTFSDRIGIVCSRPVYIDGKLAAVVGADLFLDELEKAIEDSVKPGRFSVILNQDGHVIISPVTDGVFKVQTSVFAKDLRLSSEKELAAYVTDTLNGEADVRLATIGGKEYYLSGAAIPTTGWAVLSVVDREQSEESVQAMLQEHSAIQTEAALTYRASMSNSQKTLILLLSLIVFVVISNAWILGRRIVHPLEAMTKQVGGLSSENRQFLMEDTYRTGDEVEALAECFADISAKTIQYVEEVKRVTGEKERIGAELSMATNIQESQLPHIFPPYPERKEFDLFASMTPAREVGGDFYDFFLVDPNHLCMVIADVSGKGIPAALFMMISRIMIKTRIQSGETPGEALEHVNQQLLEGNEAGMFVTVWLAVFDIRTGDGLAVNAGHEHPALRRSGGDYELVKYRHSPAVAAIEDIPFRQHSFHMNPGDSLFVYTDGVPEATDRENVLFGTDRMLAALNRRSDAAPKETLEDVMDGILDFTEDAEQFDDITMLCFSYYGPEGKRS